MDKSRHFHEEIVTYLMGEMPARQKEALEEHLHSCEACSKLLGAYRQTLRASDAIPDIEPPPDYTQRVLTAARAAREQLLRREAQQALSAQHLKLDMPPSSSRETLTYRIAKLVAFASVVIIVFIATSTVIDKEAPPTSWLDAPLTEPSAEKGIDTANAGKPATFAPAFTEPVEPNVEHVEKDLHIDVPPLTLEEPFVLILPPIAATTDLHVVRAAVPNSAYRARLDWRKKKQALQIASAGRQAASAIVQGLWWLVRHQDPDGKWDAQNFSRHCRQSRKCANRHTPVLSNEGVTAAALLAMLGDGHTPARGKFKARVARGIHWLQSRQQKNGAIGDDKRPGPHFLLSHAMATAALAEAYGMTGDARHRIAAQKAVNYLLRNDVAILDERLRPNPQNISIAAVRMAALRAAQIARLDLPRESSATAAGAFAQASKRSSEVYTGVVTAGMLALLVPTEKADTSLKAGEMVRLRANPPDWKTNGQLYWLCGSVIMKQAGGAAWRRWNRALQQTLIPHQRESGHAIGSWAINGAASRLGGRVLSTALSVVALEIPYR